MSQSWAAIACSKPSIICKAAKVERKHNALRHSYISYRLASVQGNKGLVASEAGNSPDKIHSNYREIVTPKAAAAWFTVMPNIEALPAAAEQKIVAFPKAEKVA